MDFILYRLPDGRIAPCDATATKGARIIQFTLEGGDIVDALRVDIDLPPSPAERAEVWQRYFAAFAAGSESR